MLVRNMIRVFREVAQMRRCPVAHFLKMYRMQGITTVLTSNISRYSVSICWKRSIVNSLTNCRPYSTSAALFELDSRPKGLVSKRRPPGLTSQSRLPWPMFSSGYSDIELSADRCLMRICHLKGERIWYSCVDCKLKVDMILVRRKKSHRRLKGWAWHDVKDWGSFVQNLVLSISMASTFRECCWWRPFSIFRTTKTPSQFSHSITPSCIMSE